jgi:hypothetical protein
LRVEGSEAARLPAWLLRASALPVTTLGLTRRHSHASRHSLAARQRLAVHCLALGALAGQAMRLARLR